MENNRQLWSWRRFRKWVKRTSVRVNKAVKKGKKILKTIADIIEFYNSMSAGRRL